MKKIRAFITLSLILLLLLGGCKKEKPLPAVRDTLRYAHSPANSLAAEQDHYYAMRGKNEKDEVGLILFDTETEESRFLFAENVYQIGMIGNKIYYRCIGKDGLYCFTPESGEQSLLIEDLQVYQIMDQTLYYLPGKPGSFYKTMDLLTGETADVPLKNKADNLWVSDNGVYYTTDTATRLYFHPFTGEEEQLLYTVKDEAIVNVLPITGEDIAFLSIRYHEDSALMVYYDAISGKAYPQVEGNFETFGYARGHAITVKGSDILAVNFEEGEAYSWGQLDQMYDYYEVMENQIIFYKDDHPYIRSYPTKNA